MRKAAILFFTALLVFACSNKTDIQKPKKFIEKEVMENILYDLAILQALKSYSPNELKENSINSKTYIYQKYNIDSTQFAENNKYYSSNMTEYKLLFERVVARLENEKKISDNIARKEFNAKQQKISDSLKKASKAKKIKKVIARG